MGIHNLQVSNKALRRNGCGDLWYRADGGELLGDSGLTLTVGGPRLLVFQMVWSNKFIMGFI